VADPAFAKAGPTMVSRCL